MRQKWSELTEAAWTARLWAFYRQLPDSFKAGFTAMAQGMALEIEQQADGPPEQRGTVGTVIVGGPKREMNALR
ncbi:MAG: hypothetical protein LBT13_07125 [Treponema sp.]|jgi:hypothetical protein|nr:hypothetical protein [Treponema sp.]